MLWMLIACAGEYVDIEDGVFTLERVTDEDFQELDMEENGVNGLTMTLEGLQYEFRLGDELISGELVLKAEEDWTVGCPTNFSAIDLMTYELEAPLVLGAFTYDAPVLAGSCTQGGALHVSQFGDFGSTGGCITGTCLAFSN